MGAAFQESGAFPPKKEQGWREKCGRDMIPHPVTLWTMQGAKTRPLQHRVSQPHGCNVPEQSQACDPKLTHSSHRAASHQLLSIQNSRKAIMSNGEEMEITIRCYWAGVSRQEAVGKVYKLYFLTGWSLGIYATISNKKKKMRGKKDTGSWKDVLKFLYLCQSPCPKRANAWRKLKATALHSTLLPIQARQIF